MIWAQVGQLSGEFLVHARLVNCSWGSLGNLSVPPLNKIAMLKIKTAFIGTPSREEMTGLLLT
jgi:hypothetical protein